MTTNTVKIVIVDDHALYRLGVRSVIEDQLPECSIVGEYSTGQELLVKLENCKNLPDLILLDIVMPEISGIEIAQILREQCPETRIIMLSSESTPETVEQLLKIGVNGYLNKAAVQTDLINAIRSVMDGEPFYGKIISKIMYDTYIAKNNATTSKCRIFGKSNEKIILTDREKEVIKLLCDGKTVKEIADILCVSPRTVDSHKYNVLQKLDFHNTAELVQFALKEGIL